jgi:Fe2+ transport system protein FeoA
MIRAEKTIPLDRLPAGSSGIVRSFEGGKVLTSRLSALGISIGITVKVLQNGGNGPLLTLVRSTRIALGRRTSGKIMVEKK